MQPNGLMLAFRFAKVGLIVACSMILASVLFGSLCPELLQFLWAPAGWAAELWSETLHLPPRNELGYCVVYLMFFLQWFVLGVLAATWWHWIRHADLDQRP